MTLAANQWLVFEIPPPISVNAMYENVSAAKRDWALKRGWKMRGRAYTVAYKNWRVLAQWDIKMRIGNPIPHCAGPFHLDVTLTGGIDIDNIKCLADLIKWIGIIKDDGPKYMRSLQVRQEDEGPCIVRIRPVGEWEA